MSEPQEHAGYLTTVAAEAVAFGQELVRTPSPSGEERAAADLVEREMQMLGYDRVTRDDLGSVIGIVRGARPGRTVLLDAHLDTAPIVAAECWRYAPYEGAVAEGRLWGRGAADAKGPLAAAVVAVGSLERTRLAGTRIVVASVGGEHAEGLALAYALRQYPADLVCICEPTGLALGVGQKGRAGLALLADGWPAHAACPELGINAVYLALQAITRLRAMPLPYDARLGRATLEVVSIRSQPEPAGHTASELRVVPDRCLVHLDRRLVRDETRGKVLEELHQALAGVRGVQIHLQRTLWTAYTGRTFEMDEFLPAWVQDEASTDVQRARAALAALGQAADVCLVPYTSNGVASAGELHIPTLLYGPGEIEKAHGVDEGLCVQELGAALNGYRALAYALG